eukprot:EG_transcript_10524
MKRELLLFASASIFLLSVVTLTLDSNVSFLHISLPPSLAMGQLRLFDQHGFLAKQSRGVKVSSMPIIYSSAPQNPILLSSKQAPQEENAFKLESIMPACAIFALVPLLPLFLLKWFSRPHAATMALLSEKQGLPVDVSLQPRRVQGCLWEPRRRSHALHVFKYFESDRMNPEVRKRWELEDPIEDEDGELIDVHDWVTLPWDGDWYRKPGDEYIEDPVGYREPEPEPMTYNDMMAEWFRRTKRLEEQKMWDEAKAETEPAPYPVTYDIRTPPKLAYKVWTEEEIDEYIGDVDPGVSENHHFILNPFDSLEITGEEGPYIKDNIEWLEDEGLLLKPGDLEDEEVPTEERDPPVRERPLPPDYEYTPGEFMGDDTLRYIEYMESENHPILQPEEGSDDDQLEWKGDGDDQDRYGEFGGDGDDDYGGGYDD